MELIIPTHICRILGRFNPLSTRRYLNSASGSGCRACISSASVYERCGCEFKYNTRRCISLTHHIIRSITRWIGLTNILIIYAQVVKSTIFSNNGRVTYSDARLHPQRGRCPIASGTSHSSHAINHIQQFSFKSQKDPTRSHNHILRIRAKSCISVSSRSRQFILLQPSCVTVAGPSPTHV